MDPAGDGWDSSSPRLCLLLWRKFFGFKAFPGFTGMSMVSRTMRSDMSLWAGLSFLNWISRDLLWSMFSCCSRRKGVAKSHVLSTNHMGMCWLPQDIPNVPVLRDLNHSFLRLQLVHSERTYWRRLTHHWQRERPGCCKQLPYLLIN